MMNTFFKYSFCRLTVGANKSEEFLLQFSPPKHSKPGDSTSISVTASADANPNIRNSLVFYLAVIPEVFCDVRDCVSLASYTFFFTSFQNRKATSPLRRVKLKASMTRSVEQAELHPVNLFVGMHQ